MKLDFNLRKEDKEMIEIDGFFSDVEKIFIYNLNEYFCELTNNNVFGKVINRGGFVRYEISLGEKNKTQELVLQFCVRDHENVERGCYNFVHISNILVPYVLRRNGIAKGIITIMSKIANELFNMLFFITGIVNDGWKESLISHGGIEDQSGDIVINYNRWKTLNTKYSIAFLNKEGVGYSETEPYLYDCCCIEELKIGLRKAKDNGFKKVIPFYSNGFDESYTWDYVEQNKIDIEI